MRVKFLGTAAAEGVPGIFCECEVCEKTRKLKGKNIRTRSQCIINDELLIDFPQDTYLHILRDGLNLNKINHLIITHEHPDHFYPEDFAMRLPGRSNLEDDNVFNIYSGSAVIEKIKAIDKMQDMIDIGCIKLNQLTAYETFRAMDYLITPLKADHCGHAKDPFMYLIQKDEKTVLYAHDTGYFVDETWEWLDINKPKIDFATFDCCFGLKESDRGHMGFNTVLKAKKRLEEMKIIDDNTICCINHFSHNAGQTYEEMEQYASKYGIITSYDGLEINF